MRILLLNSDPDSPAEPSSRRAVRLRGLAAGLLRAGHRVEAALAARPDHVELAPLESRGLALHPLPRRPARDVLDRLMAASRPDVVLEQIAPLAPHAAEASAHAGIVHLYEIQSPVLEAPRTGPRRDGDEFESCLRRGFAASRGAVVPSVEVGDWARRLAPREFEIALLPAWDGAAGAGAPDARLAAWARDMMGARPGEFVAGFCGSLKPWHDLELLVRAMGRLRARVPARLVLSGDGPARNALVAATHREGVPAVFCGAVARAEARALMAGCDAIVIPYAGSGSDFSPLKLVEAITAGRPLVATDTTATRRVLGEGSFGLLVPAGDEAALAAALERLATQPELRERLAAAARKRAVEHVEWDASAERLLAFAAACRSRAEHCA